LDDGCTEISSLEGMKCTVATSNMLKTRLKMMDEKVEDLKDSIKDRNFSTFGEIIMRESNQLQAVCADTFPPLQ